MEAQEKQGKNIKFWLSRSECAKLRQFAAELDIPIAVALRMIILSVLDDDGFEDMEDFSLDDYCQDDID